jgi:Integrase zinc binding domain
MNTRNEVVSFTDLILRSFRLEGEGMDPAGTIESDSEDDETLPVLREIDRYAIFCKFHNSCVGHFGITNTLQVMSLAGHEWRGMRKDVTNWIGECGICQ